MKRLFPFLLVFLITQSGFAQHVAWVKQWGDENYNLSLSPATDAQGNVYVCGSFQGTLDFDPGPGVTNLTSHGNEDAYICMFSPQGDLIWARGIGGSGHDYAKKIALSSAGYLYVMGGFQGTVDFNSGPGNMSVTSELASATYLVKYDQTGNPVWVSQWGVSPTNLNFTIDTGENILLAGRFHGTRDFDPGSGTYSMTSVSAFGSDLFICKLNSGGQFVWALQIPNVYFYPRLGMGTDFQGNLYLSGTFDTTVDFNPGPGVDSLTTPYEDQDIFMAKYAPDGQFVWVRRLRTNSPIDIVPELVADSAGNTYYGAGFTGAIDMDPGPGIHYFFSSGNRNDAYLVKLDTDGNYVWSRTYSSPGAETIQNLASGPDGNLYTAGFFTGTTDFDPGAGIHTMTTAGGAATFLSVLDTSGSFLWSTYLENVPSSGITVDADKNVYISGRFVDTADFNPEGTSLPLFTTGAGNNDAYLAKIASCVPDFTALNASDCISYTWPLNGGTYYQSGIYYQTVLGSGGCDSTLILHLHIPIIYNTPAESNGVLVANQSQTVDSYQWFNCDLNAPLNGATNPVLLPPAAGNYALIVELDGCIDTSACLLMPLDITEAADAGIQLYPNPVQEKLYVKLTDMAPLSVDVADMAGKSLYRIQNVSDGTALPVGDLKPGLYIVRIYTGVRQYTYRIIKQ